MACRVRRKNCPTAARSQQQVTPTSLPGAERFAGPRRAMRVLYKFLVPMRCSPHLRRWERFAPVTGRRCTRVSIRCSSQPLMPDLFTAARVPEAPPNEGIAPGAMLLRGFALPFVNDVLGALGDITA